MYPKNSLDNKKSFNAALSVDCVIFGLDHGDLKVLLIKSDFPIFIDQFSLLGDLVGEHEDIDEAAYRVLAERTGLQDLYLEQVGAFGKSNRHPSGRVLSIAYYTLVNIEQVNNLKQDNELHWHDVKATGKLAFDHNEILEHSISRLQHKIRAEPVGFNLLPKKFSLRDLQNLYESVLFLELDRRNFRKKFLSTGLLIDTKETEVDVPHRPAKLYEFNRKKYDEEANGNPIW